MKSTQELIVKFDGNKYDEHSISASELAEALVALGELIEETNKVVNSKQANIIVNVKAHEAGSFELLLDVYQQSAPLIDQFVQVFGSNTMGAVLNANEIIGLLFGNEGILDLIKWLKNRKIQNIEPTVLSDGSEGYSVQTEDSEERKITKFELEAFRSVKIRKTVETITKKRIEKGAKEISFIYKDNDKTVVNKIDSSNASYFEAPEDVDEHLSMIEEVVSLEIVNIAFKDNNKWRFTDGATTFYAIVDDEDFISKVKSNQSAFAHDDILKVKLEKSQYITGSGLKTEYRIIRVLEHRSRARQLEMPFKRDI